VAAVYNSLMEDLKTWKTWKFLVIAALVDWVLIHLLDTLKTGTASLAGKILAVITLGSHTLRDAPYSVASTNPYPMPGMLAVLAILSVSVLWTLQKIWNVFGGLVYRDLKEHIYKAFPFFIRKRSTPSGPRSEIRSSEAELGNTLIVLFVLIGIELFTIVSTVTLQAIEIRQSFDANLDIVSPYITSQQILESRSEFAQIKTQQQYRDLISHFKAVADSHHLKLRDPNP
jgi:hypothetical protein